MKYIYIISLLLTLSFSSTYSLAKPASKKSIKVLMERTGAARMSMQMMDLMIPQLKKVIPDAPEEFWQEIKAEVDETKIIDLIIPVYQKYLTEKDIQEINQFYNTEAGKKLVRVQPEILKETMDIGQQWGQSIARDIINKFKKQTKNKNSNKI